MLFNQVTLMTTSFRETALPWTTRSKWVGYSCFCYAALTPVHWIYAVQAQVAYMSDYIYAGVPHVSHGLDRCLSTALTGHMAWYVARHYGWYVFLGVIPIGFLYADMRAVRRKDWGAYVRYHTLWHITGPGLVIGLLVV